MEYPSVLKGLLWGYSGEKRGLVFLGGTKKERKTNLKNLSFNQIELWLACTHNRQQKLFFPEKFTYGVESGYSRTFM